MTYKTYRIGSLAWKLNKIVEIYERLIADAQAQASKTAENSKTKTNTPKQQGASNE